MNIIKIACIQCSIRISWTHHVSLALINVHRYVSLLGSRCTSRFMLYIARNVKIQSIHIRHQLLHIIFRIIIRTIESIIWIMTSRCNMSTITMSSNINMRIHGFRKIIIWHMWHICELYLGLVLAIMWCSVTITLHLKLATNLDASSDLVINKSDNSSKAIKIEWNG